MNKKVTGLLSIFLLLMLVSSATVSPLATQIAIAQIPIDPSTVTLLVESSDVSGNSFSGMWVELWHNDVIVQEGFTHFSAEVESSVTYEMFMDNWQDITFDHWEDGSTNPRRSITPTQDVSLTAFFRTGSTPTNSPPVASNDSVTTNEDTSITIDVLGNDSDQDGDGLSVTSISAPSNGNATINSDNTITYSPNQNFAGNDSFAYSISDGNGGTTAADVSITVNSVNDVPVAANDSAVINKDATVTISVLANDSDPDGDALTVASASSPSNGTAIVNSNDTITYTPNQNFTGTDSFDYSMSDGNGGNDTALIFITVKNSTGAPNNKHQVIATIHVKINPQNIDVNPDSDKIYVTHYYSYSEGKVSVIDWKNNTFVTEIPVRYASEYVSVNPDTNKIYITHNGGFNNNIDRVSVIDGITNTVKTVVSIPGTAKRALGEIVTNPITNQIYIAGYHTELLYVINGTNDTVMREIPISGGPNNIGVNPVTNMIYTSQYYANTVSVIDGSTNTLIDTIPFNEALRGIAVNEKTNKIYVGGNRTVYVIDGTTNTIDSNIHVSSSSQWSLSIDANPTTNLIYVADQGGDAIFVINGSTNTVTERVPVGNHPSAITVNHNTNLVHVTNNADSTVSVIDGDIFRTNSTTPNNSPNASDDSVSTFMNESVTIPVLVNDTDPDGDALIVDSISTQPGNGIAVINQDNTITYTPNQDFAGLDSFGYVISDGMGGADSTTVSVTVNLASSVSTLGHIFVEQTTSQTRTTNTYADISGATMADANLEDGKKYLLVFTAQVSYSDINQNGFIRAVRGSTPFEGSELAFEPTWGGHESRYQYFWFTVWSAAAGEDVKLQFRTEAASGDAVRADQITMTAIKLSDDLTENTDWFFSEQMTDAALAPSYGTGNSASVTLTPNGSDDWLVLATAQLDPASLTVPQKTRIAASGGVTDTGVEWWQEGEDATNDRMVQTLAKVYNPAATGTTFATNSGSSSGTGTRLYNSVFALNLDKMQNHAFQAMPGKITMDTTDNFATSTNVATATITPNVAGYTWCLGFGVSSSTDQDYVRARMQLDNTDQPDTQTSDFYGTPDSTWDVTDKYGYALQTIENLSAVSHTLDVDSTTGFSGVTMEDRLAMCATMRLAP